MIVMENQKKYLTIRKFSQLTHTTIDTLKHYDDIGLLKPAFIGKNHYRYYLPEQSLILTRILFGKNACIPLKEIREFIQAENHTATMSKYNEIASKLKGNMEETKAILNTISNLRYYYQISNRFPPKKFFNLYLPEWFIIQSEQAKTDQQFESSESNIANQLFTEGFADEKWPHYLLQALFTEEQIRKKDFSKVTYFLKVDHPEFHRKEQIQFIPNGEWICMLFYVCGRSIADCVTFYIEQLQKEHQSIKGPIFIMDIVNCLITSKAEDYCTMIYAMKESQIYEEY